MDSPSWKDISAMALALFLALTSLSVATFFYHFAYGYYVPALAGMSVALQLASTEGTGTSARRRA